MLFFLFQKTKIGLAMRAVANNGDVGASLVGMPDRASILMMSWASRRGAIGALGGAMIASIDTGT